MRVDGRARPAHGVFTCFKSFFTPYSDSSPLLPSLCHGSCSLLPYCGAARHGVITNRRETQLSHCTTHTHDHTTTMVSATRVLLLAAVAVAAVSARKAGPVRFAWMPITTHVEGASWGILLLRLLQLRKRRHHCPVWGVGVGDVWGAAGRGLQGLQTVEVGSRGCGRR